MELRGGAASAREAIAGVTDAVSVRRVFGEPVERDGVTVIPAATVIGGGGGGTGHQSGEGGPEGGESSGVGFGLIAWPSGAYELRGDEVRWRPAIDLTRLGIAALVLAFLAVRSRPGR